MEAEARMHARALVQKEYEVQERLSLLGLSAEILQAAGRSGKLARLGSTPFHPKWYPGNVMYSKLPSDDGAVACTGRLPTH